MIVKKMIEASIRNYREKEAFSKPLAFYYAINTLTSNYLEKHRRTINMRHNILCREICKQIPQTLKKYDRIYKCGERPAQVQPIWLCWLQGYDDMNDFIKRCVKSLFDNAGNHPVIFIDNNNVEDFITIPEHIRRKRKEGKISAALYCDLIRMMLLKQYGGLWVDADLFVSKQISEDFFSKSFVSEKNNHVDISYKESIGYISKGNWSVQVIGGWKNDGILSFVCDGLIEYWKNCDKEIDYYLFDYMIEIARRNLCGANKAIKDGAVDNGHYRILNQAMKLGKHADCYDECITEDTTFNTLNWKNEYPLKTETGEDAVCSRFLLNPTISEDELCKNHL